MKNIFCTLLILTIALNCFGQRRTGKQLIRSGLVKIGIHAGPSFLLNPSLTYVNTGGELEVYISRRFSLRGDFSFSIPTPQSIQTVVHNHSMFWGMNYHLPYKKLDFLIGIHPGFSVVQGVKADKSLATTKVVPVISALGGFHWYFSRYFHCSLLARFVAGTYYSDAASPINLYEVRVMAGIGFNINLVPLKRAVEDID